VRIEQEAECVAYVRARLEWLRRLAYLMCQDWDRADDIAQTTITKIYVNWRRVRDSDNPDAYSRTILVRVFLADRRSAWSRVRLDAEVPDPPPRYQEESLDVDVRAAVKALPPRQRATLVLRYFCDMSVAETAEVLGCTEGTVKSQSAKAFAAMRAILAAQEAPARAVTGAYGGAGNG
jgi:RNA polymerase sigma-70 factor (sigma-E family)